MSQEFKALIEQTTFNAAGKLSPKQASTFVDRSFDSKVILKECQIKKMTTNEEDIDLIGMTNRAMRKHVSGQKGTSTDITTSKRTIKLTEGKIWFELDIRTLRRLTIESDGQDFNGALMRHIMELGMVTFGNDSEDLGINGNTAYTGSEQDFITITDGWLKKAIAEGVNFDVANSVDYYNNIFPAMLSNLHSRYKGDHKKLRFYVPDAIREAYIKQLASLNNASAMDYITGVRPTIFREIPVVGVPSFTGNNMMLTMPENLVFGIDINGVERDFGKKVVERVLEAVIIAPIGYEIADEQAIVVGRKIT